MRTTKQRRLTAAVAAFAGISLFAAACGDDGTSSTTGDTTQQNAAASADGGGSLGGSIVITGSSTVEPISIDVARKFNAQHGNVNISVDGPGTGDGFELFCNGDADINDASSKVKPAQEEACADNGVEFIELRIGNDGIALMTNSANDALECLSFADIYALLGPESQGFDRWSDAQSLANELGSSTSLPDAPLDIVGPGEESGTFSSFVELVIEEFNEDRGEDATTRPDYQSSADDNVIITGIQGSDTSLGWVGFAFADQAENVKVLEVAEEGNDCVAPTPETIADNSYPISRPLFIYVNKAKAESNPALAAFVDHYLSDEGIASVSEVGYVDLSSDALAETRAVWEAREVGPQ